MPKSEIKANPVVIEKYLKGIDYPAGRKDLVNQAKKNDANKDIIDTLKSLPDSTYHSPIDISKALAGHDVASTSASSGEKIGLAAADKETRERVARAGGTAPHEVRGLQTADEETRERVARAGGAAPHEVRGLQAAEEETRERVARAGGTAPHEVRGLQAADEETRERVARAGGTAPHEVRGLQAADEETRKRVAKKGGEASASGKKSS